MRGVFVCPRFHKLGSVCNGPCEVDEPLLLKTNSLAKLFNPPPPQNVRAMVTMKIVMIIQVINHLFIQMMMITLTIAKRVI